MLQIEFTRYYQGTFENAGSDHIRKNGIVTSQCIGFKDNPYGKNREYLNLMGSVEYGR